MTPYRRSLIAAARERADFLESPIPESIEEQEKQARAMRSNRNTDWTRGSEFLRELANELESPRP